MVEPGGIRDITELKLLVLYVLSYCTNPIPFITLNDILMRDGLVDFFDFTVALDQMVTSGHVQKLPPSDPGDGDRYTFTPLGQEAISRFQNHLTYTMRDKSVRSARAVLREKYMDTIMKTDFYRRDDGSYTVTLSLSEPNAIDSMKLDFNVPTIEQARFVCSNFKNNTSEIFAGIVDLLTRDWKKPRQ